MIACTPGPPPWTARGLWTLPVQASFAVMAKRAVLVELFEEFAPRGRHLPTINEWETLFAAVGGTIVAGTELKSTSGWYNGGNGDDNFGFSVLPADYCDYGVQ